MQVNHCIEVCKIHRKLIMIAVDICNYIFGHVCMRFIGLKIFLLFEFIYDFSRFKRYKIKMVRAIKDRHVWIRGRNQLERAESLVQPCVDIYAM